MAQVLKMQPDLLKLFHKCKQRSYHGEQKTQPINYHGVLFGLNIFIDYE